MASSTPTTPAMEAGIESARTALAAAMSGKAASAPVPAAETAPAPPAATPPATTPAPVSAPGAPAAPVEAAPTAPAPPAPPAPATPTPSPAPGTAPVPPAAPGQPVPLVTDPAAQRFLEMHGGNVEAALAAALRYNNRLASLAKASPDLFKPGAPADPSLALPPDASTPFVDPATLPVSGAAATQAPTPPTAGAEPELNWEQILADVDQRAAGDTTCQSLMQAWTQNTEAIQQASHQVQEKSSRLSYIDSLLSDKGMDLPELKREELSDERRSLQLDVNMLKQDAYLRVMTNRDLDAQFRERRRAFVDEVSTTYRTQAQEQAAQAELTQLETAEYQRLSTHWPAAIASAVQAHNIPPELREDFAAYAKQTALANRAANPNGFVIEDVAGFVNGVAPAYLQRLDTYHRAQAARYATQATTRAATPAPTPPPGTPAAPVPDPAKQSPEEIMIGISRDLASRMGRR